ncbi:hypothetical protein MTR_0115s0010 [Medicago truncatula]|uniref:Uncharacterized protein n=1 Tax=Medicago truncatula TaxID=3880 RepID=A0A072TGJ4_MEDTR|nr:hypothetical protein MTR_0115s0010 [Medicago truncatula]
MGGGAMHRNNNNSSKSPSGSMLVAFPNLDILTLSSLNWNKVWGDNQHSFCKLTNLVVDNYDVGQNEFVSCVGEEEGIGSFGEDEGMNIILIILVPRLRGRPIQQLRWHV